jgi:hypothetical protein
MEPMKTPRLSIRNFAQVAEADIRFGDLTVLVGAQGTGKSLALQWLKFALDGRAVADRLEEAGYTWTNERQLVDLLFGQGMASAWNDLTSVRFDGQPVRLDTLRRRKEQKERVFFVPAHRATLISDGWAQPLQKLSTDVPVVARIFSHTLFRSFTAPGSEPLFPRPGKLKGEIRELIGDAVFHGGDVVLETEQMARRLRLKHGDASLPPMTWTAGQREFTPLLLGLYDLLPAGKIVKDPDIEWVIIEEPEMGLHPQALTAVLLLVLDLVARGYRVVLSSHSPHVLTAVWMLQIMKQLGARWQLLCEAFGVDKSGPMQKLAQTVLKKEFSSVLMAFGADGRVSSKDISSLDPGDDDDDISGWGGLTGFSSRFGDAVRKAVNESER